MAFRHTIFALASVLLGGAMPAYAQDAAGAAPQAAEAAPQLPTTGNEVEVAMLDLDRIGTPRRPAPEKIAKSPFNPSFSLTAASDYRYRGSSLSGGKPALQAELALEHESGLFGSLWASNYSSGGGSKVEVDASFGLSRDVGNVTLQGGVAGYFYPGLSGATYFELQTGVSTKVGEAELSAHLSYAPAQSNIGGQDNIYAAVGFDLPFRSTPFSINGSFGLENGAFGDKKVDWALGGTYSVMGVDLGVTYVDAARTFGVGHSGPRAIFSVARQF